MRAYYPDDFLGPPVLNLAPKAVTHLFAEFDQIAEELRRDPMFVTGDLQIAFRQLQKLRLPNLSRDEWLWLFEIWYDHDHARQEIDVAKRAARLADLCAEQRLDHPERHARTILGLHRRLQKRLRHPLQRDRVRKNPAQANGICEVKDARRP